MNVIDITVQYLRDFAMTSEANYHVNPWIFCILFFGSALPLYYGYYRIGESALKIEDRKLKRKKVDTRELKIGVTISVIAWWIPYLYVIMFGKLPLDIWIVFGVFVLVMGVIFVKTLIDKIVKATKE